MQTILGTLQRATNLLKQRVDERLVELGLSARELQVMRMAVEEAGTTTADIREATGLRPSTLSSLLTRLVRMGYVRRRPTSKDRRSWEIEPTLPGQMATWIGTDILVDLEAEIGSIQVRTGDLARLADLVSGISNLYPVAITPEDALPALTA